MGNYEIRDKIIYIHTVADLSVQELEELQKRQKIDQVAIVGEYNNNGNERPYSVKEYKKIYSKLKEYTEGINPEWSTEKKFIYLFGRVSRDIEYDHIAAYPKEGDKSQQEYSKKNVNSCRNLKNGLLEGKCVCAGYAEILRHACALEDIDCRYVRGTCPPDNEGHAWNIVEVEDGKWIEVDPTWSHETGIEYIGDDREKFWNEHSESYYSNKESTYSHSRFFNFPAISNLDLNKFINSELGITQERRYTKEQQAKLIELLESRDVNGIDITETVSEMFKERDEFEQEVGYTVEQLQDIGIDYAVIMESMKVNYDTETGKRIDKKTNISKLVEQAKERIRKFEQEVGYTREELQSMGFSIEQIKDLMNNNYDGQTGEKIDKKAKLELQIEQKNNIPEERKILEKVSAGMVHPKVIDLFLTSIHNGDLTIEEAVQILEANKDNIETQEVTQIKERMDSKEKKKIEDFHKEYIKKFEEEVGYTVEQLKGMGFTDKEIEAMEASYNGDTGEKLDRKEIVEKAIQDKNDKNILKRLKKVYKKFSLRREEVKDSSKSLEENQNELTNRDTDKEEVK